MLLPAGLTAQGHHHTFEVHPLLGIAFSGHVGAEAGLVHPYNFGPTMHMDCYDCPDILSNRAALSLSVECYPGYHTLIAPKLAWWGWQDEREWILLGAEGLYVYEPRTGSGMPVLRPEIGL